MTAAAPAVFRPTPCDIMSQGVFVWDAKTLEFNNNFAMHGTRTWARPATDTALPHPNDAQFSGHPKPIRRACGRPRPPHITKRSR
ncbi:hypothetical protein [Limimonas halophila]|uniref:hypothetical protein n=1 Tax=Limimonas halophila TaxID=1082479 RepID=UPI000B7D82C6|nr:hypothetical protein [Limimonas halophila]